MTTVSAPVYGTQGRVVQCEQCDGSGVVVRLPRVKTGRFNYALWRDEVTEAEIDWAIQHTAKHPRPREKIRWNIAFGKWVGTYQPDR